MPSLDQLPFLTCPIKLFTHIPCPGCGLTRGMIALSHGNVGAAIFSYNALSVVLFPLMSIVAIWGLFDVITGRDGLCRNSLRIDRLLNHKIYLFTLFAITALNWIWNIYKGL